MWAYRKAAWAVPEATQRVAEMRRMRGEAGLPALPWLGAGLAGHVARFLGLGAPEREGWWWGVPE